MPCPPSPSRSCVSLAAPSGYRYQCYQSLHCPLAPSATTETRKLDSPKRSVELTTCGIRIPFLVARSRISLLFVLPSDFSPIRVHRISTLLEIPYRLSLLRYPIFRRGETVSFLYFRESRFLYSLRAWSGSAILRQWRKDGGKSNEKN